MSRLHANADWIVEDDQGRVPTWERVSISVLLDIRAELQTLNGLLACPNFVGIPRTLTAIQRNTTRKRKRKLKVRR